MHAAATLLVMDGSVVLRGGLGVTRVYEEGVNGAVNGTRRQGGDGAPCGRPESSSSSTSSSASVIRLQAMQCPLKSATAAKAMFRRDGGYDQAIWSGRTSAGAPHYELQFQAKLRRVTRDPRPATRDASCFGSTPSLVLRL